MAKDYYAILEIDRSATQDEIKKAYRKLSKKYHPDKTDGDKVAEEKFKEVAEAYEILSDETKKQKFDNFGSSGGHEDFEDIVNQYKNAFHGFGHAQGQAQRIIRGQSIVYTIMLTLEEIQKGASKAIQYHKNIMCSTCSGNGSKFGKSLKNCSMCLGSGMTYKQFGYMRIQSMCEHCGGNGNFIVDACDDCGGSGVKSKEMNVEVHIPAGVFHGWKSGLSGFGHDAISYAPNSIPGDLIIIIEEKPHTIFDRQGDDIVYQLQMNFPDIVLGKKVIVPILGGEITFDVSSNTPLGKIFRVKGRGIPSIAHKGHIGDLLVTVGVNVPEQITEEEKKLLEKLQKCSNFVEK